MRAKILKFSRSNSSQCANATSVWGGREQLSCLHLFLALYIQQLT